MANQSFIVDAVGGISGSLTTLVDGTSYLVAGTGVSITSQSNGSVLVSSTQVSSTPTSLVFGSGQDGSATCDGSATVSGMALASGVYTLSRDVFFSALTILSGVLVNTNGYRVFCRTSLTLNGTLACTGSNGVGESGSGIAAGGSKNVLGGGTNGGYWYAGSPVDGGDATSVLGGSGGSGGHSSAGSGNRAGGLGGAATAGIPVGSIPEALMGANWFMGALSAIVGGTGGGPGGFGNFSVYGAGGGGGGVVLVSAFVLDGSGLLTTAGGNGGDDLNSSDGGGAGGGGGGGVVLTIYASSSFAGTTDVSGGLGGASATGTNGSSGTAGHVYWLQN